MRPSEDLKKLIKNMSVRASAELDNRIYGEIDKAAAEAKKRREPVGEGPTIGRIIMRSPITKLAIAAVIIIAVMLGIYLFSGRMPSATCCAWAQIADRVEQIKTCIYRANIVQSKGLPGQAAQGTEALMYLSTDYGFRMDTYSDGNVTMQVYTDMDEKMMVSVIPSAKKYMRMKLTDEQIAEMRHQGQDPRDMIGKFMSGEYTELGREKIGDIEAAGIEVVNPPMLEGMYSDFVGRMWVDVETEYPVRMEIEAKIAAGDDEIELTMVMDSFEWGVELGPEVFEPNIPPDYTLLADVKMPAQDEASAIEGLRVFAELTGGRYPSQMNMTTVMQEGQKLLAKSMHLAPNTEPSQEQMQEMMGKMMLLQGPFMFYQKLVQEDKEPAYYGDEVTAEWPDSVLMQWKVSENQYRVIYGDLTAENVSGEELAEMQPKLSE